MNQIDRKEFTKKTLLGGVVILLPVALLVMGFRWLFSLVTDLIQPLTNLITNVIGMPEIFADLLVLVGMTGLCFCVGWFVTTAGGAWFHSKFDDRFSRYVPGFQMVKDIVGQFFGDATKSPFANGEVAMVRLFGKDSPTEVTAIVTSKHDDGRYTVFVATGPNPTSGNIYHVQKEQVTLYPAITVSDAMRTIIACGAGTGDLIANTSGVGQSVRTKAGAVKSANKTLVKLNIKGPCKAFLEDNGLKETRKLLSSRYQSVLSLKGYERPYVAEITTALDRSPDFKEIADFDGSDWTPIPYLEISNKLKEALSDAGYFCTAQLDCESDETLKQINGIGQKTIETLRAQLTRLKTVEKFDNDIS